MIAGGVESMTRAPFVMGKADSRVLARGEDRGHDDRLALRQSADEGEVRRRLDAGDRRERRRRLQGRARRPGRVRAAQPAARRGGDRRGTARRGDRAGDDPVEEGRSRSCSSRTSIRARRRSKRSRKLKGVVRPGRHGDRRQRVRRQRRRVRDAARVGGGGEALRPDAEARASSPRRVAGVAPRIMGFGPAPATRKVLAQGGLDDRRHGRDRAERGVRGAGARRHARPRPARRRRARQSERRRDRARPSARRERRAPRRRPRCTSCERTGGRYALCTMCIGVGQGIAMIIERDLRCTILDGPREPRPSKTLAGYRKPDRGTQPDYLYPPYASTVKRSPSQPLVAAAAHAVRGHRPLFGFDAHQRQRLRSHQAARGRADRRAHHRHRPRARRERAGRCRTRWSRSGRPTPPAAIRIKRDQHNAPTDPNFTGAGRTLTDARGPLSLRHDPARRVSVAQPLQRVAARAHPLLAVRAGVRHAPRHADVFPRRSAARRTIPMYTSIPDERARKRLISAFDWETTIPEQALGLPVRHRAARPRRDADGQLPQRSTP